MSATSTPITRSCSPEGYDRDSARFFVIEQTNVVLTRWRATRLLEEDDEDE